MLFVLALLFLQIAGNAANDTRRIINGYLAPDSEFTSTVAILKKTDGKFRIVCAGFVVGRKTVATVAHCIDCNSFNNTYFVAAGSRNVKSASRQEVVDIRCAQRDRDVALLLVDKIFWWQVPIVRIPQGQLFETNILDHCQVAGWGLLVDKPNSTATHIQPPQPVDPRLNHVGYHPVDCEICDLHSGTVNIISRQQCQGKLRPFIKDGYFLQGDKSRVCTLPVATQDPCVGDSGAPIYCDRQVYAMVYRGHPTIPCGTPDVPDIVHWMPFYRDWINCIVKKWEN